MVELLVSVSIGLIVLSALTMVIVVTLHGSAKVSARVDATQRARLVVTRIMQELHSACVAPKIAPIEPQSTGTLLKFIHADGAQGSAVAPLPTRTEISLSNGVLTQTDQVAISGSAPTWTYAPPTTRQLLTGVAPIPPSSSIFLYYASSNGSTTPTPQQTPLGTRAPLTIQVRVALSASPTSTSTPIPDANAAASVQNSATLRLTPPSFNEQAESLPCQ